MTPTGLEVRTTMNRAAAPLPTEAEQRMYDALKDSDGSVTAAAARLGVHRTTLWRWMKSRGMRREDYRA
jgi:transcriptional regulator of acetoin/glycerol metabolism